jgi:predicted transcriptional regulator
MSGAHGDPVARAEGLVVDRALDPTIPGKYPFRRLVDGVREMRIALGLTQAEAARLAGLSTGMVWRLEHGACNSWWPAVRLRTALTLLQLSAPLEDLDLIVRRVDRAIGDAVMQPTCVSCEATS